MQSISTAVLPGNVGVDLFFVLSGFLITRILLVDREAGVPLRNFLLRRFLRIFPIYYLAIGVMLPSLSAKEAVACATYTSNFAFLVKDAISPLEHTWSLAVEEHFYLLWPPVVAFLTPRASRRVLFGVVLPLGLLSGGAVLLFADWKNNGAFWLEFMTRSSTVRCFSLGLGAAFAFHESLLRGRRGLALGVVCGAAALSWATSLGGLETLGLDQPIARFYSDRGQPWLPAFQGFYVYSVPLGSLAAVIAAVAFTGTRAPHAIVLRAGPLRAIGRVSYGIYLYHFPIFVSGAFAPGGGAQPGHVAAAVALCLLVAAASYVLLERPILEVAKRFRAAEGATWSTPFSRSGWIALLVFVPILAWILNGDARTLVHWVLALFG